MKVFTLKCANCGGSLEIKDDIDTFACGYCGASQIVERSGGVVTLRKLEAALDHVKESSARTASELALARLTLEISAVRAEHERTITAIKASDEQNNTTIGFVAAAGMIVAAILFYNFGWYALPVVAIGVYFGFKAVPSSADKLRRAEQEMKAKVSSLEKEIAEHQAVVSGSPRAK